MPKNPNSKPKAVKRDDTANNAMKFFLAGCVAELYLFIIRRYYVNGYAAQQIAWYDTYLKALMAIGAIALIAGAVFFYLRRQNKAQRAYGLAISGAGAFLAVSSFLVRWNMTTLTLLTVLVPVAALLAILWVLYDHECALALTILGLTLVALWVCRRTLANVYLGTVVTVLTALYITLLIVVALLTKTGKLARLLPANASHLPVYAACGLSVAALAITLLSTSVAYYAMWALAIIVFGLAVYYTVKQL